MKYNLWIILFLFIFENGLSNTKDFLVVDKTYAINQEIIFERFTSKNGLPDDRIRSIFQDKSGFLWIGTMNGLCKYDGLSFRKFQKNIHKNSIIGNWTFAICEDSLSQIWIGTLEGLSCFDTKFETFTNYQHIPDNPNSLIYNEIYSIIFDRYGYLWIGTAKGLTKMDPSQKKFLQFNDYPFNTAISKIIKSHGDYIWICTSEGMVHYNVVTDEYHFYQVKVNPNPFGEKFWSMVEYEHDLLIATGSHGLMKLPFNQATKTYGDFISVNTFQGFNESLENMQVFDICKSNSGELWLGTTNGLAKIEGFNSDHPKLYFYKNNPINNRSISNNSVYKVYIDNTDVLWCGTEFGLNKSDLNLLSFKFYTLNGQKSKEQIRSIFFSNSGDIWMGTASNGFFRHHTQNKISQYYRFHPLTSSLNATRSILFENNNLWLGTLGGTLKINEKQYSKELDGTTFALLKDSKKNLWVGTNKGLYKITEKGEKIHYPHYQNNNTSNRSDFIRTIYEDHNGFIWCGFENDGVSKLNPATEKFIHINKDENGNQIFGSTILSILEYPENVIWVGTESGLNKIIYENDEKFSIKNFSEDDGLVDKSISGILSDNNGHLWISTIKGLMRLNIDDETFEYFLTDFNFSVSCCYKAEDGNLFFGTDNGFIVFNPEQIHGNYHVPQTVITGFKLFNETVSIGDTINGNIILKKSVSQTEEITLNYKNNFFSIDFAAMHFSNPGKCKFLYMLKGFNPDWIYSDGEIRSATYTNLNAGTYTFMVKAANPSGVWNETPAELKIIILPPPWKTWWAISLIVIFSLGIISAIIWYYFLQLKQREQIRIEKREKEQIVQLNHMKLKFFIDIAHEFRTPLMLITWPIEELLASESFTSKVHDKIELIHRNCVKLNYLIDELMTFRKIDQEKLSLKSVKMDIVKYTYEIFNNFVPIAKQKNIHINFQSEVKESLIWIDPKRLEKVFNNLLFNAFKFTKENDMISIRITNSLTNNICIEIEDTGRGIPPDKLEKIFERFYQVDTNIMGTGIGLSLVKSIIELHHGSITVESEQNTFTRFKILLSKDDNLLTPEQKNDNVPDWKPLQLNIAKQLTINHPPSENMIKNLEIQNQGQYSILIVDDNPEVLEILRSIFEKTFRITSVDNGEKALEMVRLLNIDLIISDVMMPIMNGVDLCKSLKNDFSTCHIPVILLTAKSAVEHIIEGLEIGADDYIAKPFHPEILKAKVINLIESRKRVIEKFKTDKISDLKSLAKNSMDQNFIQNIIDVILKNINQDNFDVENLSTIIGISRSGLFRKIKAISGQNPIEFINSIRMKHAAELLVENKLNITEISATVGFQNISSFSRAFRKYFNVSPSDYLKNKFKYLS